MSQLRLAPNLRRHDDIYDRLISIHAPLDDVQSRIVDARLILILMNHIGDEDVILQALDMAGRRPASACSATDLGKEDSN